MKKLTLKDMVIFSFLGALMFASKKFMEFLPNIHPLGMFTMLFAVTFRKKGIFPVLVYILLEGLFAGFSIWWIPYIYLWPLLFGVTLLLPKNMPAKVAIPVHMIVCGLHGLLFGTLYAPFQALAFGLSFKGTLAWIAAGFPWDCIHAAGNIVFGSLIYPFSKLLKKCYNQTQIS